MLQKHTSLCNLKRFEIISRDSRFGMLVVISCFRSAFKPVVFPCSCFIAVLVLLHTLKSTQAKSSRSVRIQASFFCCCCCCFFFLPWSFVISDHSKEGRIFVLFLWQFSVKYEEGLSPIYCAISFLTIRTGKNWQQRYVSFMSEITDMGSVKFLRVNCELGRTLQSQSASLEEFSGVRTSCKGQPSNRIGWDWLAVRYVSSIACE